MRPPDNSRFVLFGGTFVLANKLQAVGDQMVEGISLKQWFLLRNLIEFPPDPLPTITQIAREMDSTRQNISKILAVLEREGYVQVEKSVIDQRSSAVRMTKKGREYTEQAAEKATVFLARLYEGIEPGQCDAAAQVLKKMIDNLLRMQEMQNE